MWFFSVFSLFLNFLFQLAQPYSWSRPNPPIPPRIFSALFFAHISKLLHWHSEQVEIASWRWKTQRKSEIPNFAFLQLRCFISHKMADSTTQRSKMENVDETVWIWVVELGASVEHVRMERYDKICWVPWLCDLSMSCQFISVSYFSLRYRIWWPDMSNRLFSWKFGFWAKSTIFERTVLWYLCRCVCPSHQLIVRP